MKMEAKKQISQSKYWIFVWNNYTEENLEILVQMFVAAKIKFVMGREVAPETGTPHIQGYLELPKRGRPSEIDLPDGVVWNKLHWEKRKKTEAQNLAYCTKDGDYVHNGFSIPVATVLVTKDMLQPWQLEIAAAVETPDHPIFGRKIFWFWEPDGRFGKTTLCKYFVDCCDAIIVGGKVADAKYGIAQRRENGMNIPLVVFNIPRCNNGGVSYEAIEAIKDGLFYSTKYESGMVRYNCPHICVFANVPPELGRLTEDRWVVRMLARTTTGEVAALNLGDGCASSD